MTNVWHNEEEDRKKDQGSRVILICDRKAVQKMKDKMQKTARLAAGLLAIGLLLGGCAQSPQVQLTENTVAPAAQTDVGTNVTASVTVSTPEVRMVEPEDNAVLLTVNGTELQKAAIDRMANQLMMLYRFSEEEAENLYYARTFAVEAAGQMEVVRQMAAQMGIYLTDEEKTTVLDQSRAFWDHFVVLTMENTHPGYANLSVEEQQTIRTETEQVLDQMGYSLENIINQDLDSALTEKLQAEVVKQVKVTDEEVLAAYNEKVTADQTSYQNDVVAYEMDTGYYGKTSYFVPDGYRGVTKILLPVADELLEQYQILSAAWEEAHHVSDEGEVTPDEGVTEAQMEAARQAVLEAAAPMVVEIRSRLASGESFDSLIDLYNYDSGMDNEQTRRDGYSVHRDSVVFEPSFVQAAFSLEQLGDVSEPVVGNEGVFLLCYVRNVPAGPVAYEEVKADLAASLLADRENTVFAETMETWMNEAEIVLTPDGEAYLQH